MKRKVWRLFHKIDVRAIDVVQLLEPRVEVDAVNSPAQTGWLLGWTINTRACLSLLVSAFAEETHFYVNKID